MLDETTQNEISSQLRTMQIIVTALCMGVVSFGVFLVVRGSDVEQPDLGILTLGAIGMAVVMGCVSFVVPALVASTSSRKIADGTWKSANPQVPTPDTDSGKLLSIYQTALIIGAALLEGPAFFALFAYMTEGHSASLIVAGVCLLLMITRFPTRGRLESWVEDQLQRIKEQRQFVS